MGNKSNGASAYHHPEDKSWRINYLIQQVSVPRVPDLPIGVVFQQQTMSCGDTLAPFDKDQFLASTSSTFSDTNDNFPSVVQLQKNASCQMCAATTDILLVESNGLFLLRQVTAHYPVTCKYRVGLLKNVLTGLSCNMSVPKSTSLNIEENHSSPAVTMLELNDDIQKILGRTICFYAGELSEAVWFSRRQAALNFVLRLA